jgi:MFS family permease
MANCLAKPTSKKAQEMPTPITPAAARAANAALFFANGFGFATWVSRIPAIRDALSLSEGQLGTALFAIAAGALVAFPLAGRGTALYGAKRIALSSGFVYCMTLVAPPFAGNLWWLAFALFIFGIANGAMDVAMNATAVEAEKYAAKPIMSSLHGMWSAGGLAGAVVGGAFAKLGVSPQLHLATIAALLLCIVLMARRYVPPTEPHGLTDATPHFALPERGMLGLGLIIFCSFLIEGAMADWSAVLMRDTMRASEAVAALGFGAFSLAMMTLRFVGDRIVERWDASALLRITNGIAALTFALALWLQHAGFTLASFAIVGCGTATVAPLVFRAAAQRSRHGPGHGIAAMATVGYTGFLIGPPMVGWIADITSLPLALLLVPALALTIAAVAGGRTLNS